MLSNEPLTSNKVFVAIALFNLLQFPLSVFPNVIASVIDASVSFSRLSKFLRAEELDPDSVERELVSLRNGVSGQIERVAVQEGSFGWDRTSESVVKNLSLSVADGQILAIVGAVGAGKSTLLSALLGDTYKHSGRVVTRGSIAYVPQNAWIMNATLKENILFGHAMEEKMYQKTLEACGLLPDLEMLPAGDMTEIGERGINLSGGQKQRISIARAVYSNSDIYLLDDPLSAVDAHVGRHIFDRVLGPRGMLNRKARILVTHGIHFLPDVDQVVMIVDGRITEAGTYTQLTQNKGAFAALVKEHGKQRSDKHQEVPMQQLAKSETVESLPQIQEKRATSNEGSKIISKEETAKGSVGLDVYRSYASACHLPSVLAFLFIAVVAQCLSVFQNVFLSWWAHSNDQGATNNKPWLAVYGLLGLGYSCMVVAQVIFVWIFCGIRAARIMHANLLESILRAPQSFFDTTPLGRIINRFSKDQYTVDEVLPRCFLGYFRTLFSVVSVLAINAIGSPYYILFAIPLAYLYSYFQKFYLSTSRELKRLESTSRSPIYAQFQETLGGLSSIRAYSQQDQFIEANEYRVDFNQRAYYPSVSSNRWLAVRLEIIGAFIVFTSALLGVLSLYFDMKVSASVIGLMLTYSLSVTQTLNWMVRQSCEIETNIVSVERIKEYIEIDKEAAYELPDGPFDGSWPKRGVIQFKNYATRYRPELDLVISNITFSIASNEKIGVVGRTGAGKSSLTLALFRIIEAASGKILIDDVDISQVGLFDLRSRITIIPQDPVLFAGTIRENLDPFGTANDADLWSALEKSNLKTYVSRNPEGLDYIVLQGGENFSVGQRQLICLARCIN